MSRILPRIISGELICRRSINRKGGADLAEHPVPLPQPARGAFNLKTGKVERILPRMKGQSTVPSFQAALKDAGRWRDCTFTEEELKERRERDT